MTIVWRAVSDTTEAGAARISRDRLIPKVNRDARFAASASIFNSAMPDSIILLTGPVEAPVLSAALLRHKPNIDIHVAQTLAELDKIAISILQKARLIAFVTPVVVPPRILINLGFGAYNFHPGPPQYPGWVPSHFAVYDKVTSFGATVHLMTERVDDGPIIAAEHFPIPENATIQMLEALAFTQLARIFWSLANVLVTQNEPLAHLPVQWGARKSTRRLYAAMCQIPLDIVKDELDRRIEAFGAGHFDIFPTINVHGHLFRYAGHAVPGQKKDGSAVLPSAAPSAMQFQK